jgi:hypothetical protein
MTKLTPENHKIFVIFPHFLIKKSPSYEISSQKKKKKNWPCLGFSLCPTGNAQQVCCFVCCCFFCPARYGAGVLCTQVTLCSHGLRFGHMWLVVLRLPRSLLRPAEEAHR